MNDSVTETGNQEAALQAAIRGLYDEVATNPSGDYHFFHGAEAVERFGYPPAALASVAPGAIARFAGVGNPLERAAITDGEDVLDLGSGAGLDAILAALRVGNGGTVYGLDFNPTMLARARIHAEESYARIDFLEGRIESIPLPDASVDVVVSNGVVNLSLQKRRVFEEMWRVLRPGGRISVCDIVSARAMPASITEDPNLWAS
jgi:arsenite methyltransferase